MVQEVATCDICGRQIAKNEEYRFVTTGKAGYVGGKAKAVSGAARFDVCLVCAEVPLKLTDLFDRFSPEPVTPQEGHTASGRQ